MIYSSPASNTVFTLRAESGNDLTMTATDPTNSEPTSQTSQTSQIDRLLAEARRRLPPRPTAAELPALIARGALIVDTRPSELRQRDGELAGAVVIDRNQLEWRLDPTSPWRIPQVTSADQEIIVVCDEGYASTLAASTLQQLGLRRATDLDGGFQALRQATQG